jgi:ketosteroid isomerase-like protein
LIETNTDILRRLYEVWNEGGAWAIAERFWVDDIEWTDPPEVPDARTYVGRRTVAAHLEEWVGSLHNFRFRIEVESFLEAGEDIVAFLWVRGGTSEGRPVPPVRFVHVVRMTGGRVTHVRAFLHAADALAAAGVKNQERSTLN